MDTSTGIIVDKPKGFFGHIIYALKSIWHWIIALVSEDPRNDIVFVIFAVASVTSIVLAVKYMGKLTDNDVKAIGILQGGGTLPQMTKSAGNLISAIKSKL